MTDLPRLYGDLAEWWPLLSAPEDYAEEAAIYREVLTGAAHLPITTVLELGSGGGNNASHLSEHFEMTLIDRSPGMLQVSRELNPDCEHHLGDMRTIRLGAEYDAVFVHDAVAYMRSLDELRAAARTAFEHCRPGGVVLFVPDQLQETFQSGADHGGHDGEGRGMRYLEWTRQPDHEGTTYVVDFAYLLHDEKGEMSVLYDRHLCGLFSRDDWLQTLKEVGLRPEYQESTLTSGEILRMFVCVSTGTDRSEAD